MGLVFVAAINSRGYTEGQKLFFCGVSRTSLSDKIKLMWLFVLISKAAGCCNVFGMAGMGGGKKENRQVVIHCNKKHWITGNNTSVFLIYVFLCRYTHTFFRYFE